MRVTKRNELSLLRIKIGDHIYNPIKGPDERKSVKRYDE